MGIITVNGQPTFQSSTQAFYHNQLKQKVLANIDTETLFKKIDAIWGLSGAGIVYIDSQYNIVELRKFEPVCQLNPIKIVLREPPQLMSQIEFAAHLRGSQGKVRESKLVGEVTGAVLSCSAALIGWFVVVGSSVAIPLTGGTSTAITYLALGATAASSLQCANGGYRVLNEVYAPEQNDYLDDQVWYQASTTAIDLVSLAGAGASAAVTLKSIKLMQAQTGKTTYDLLKGLSRPEQRRLSAELLRLNIPGVSKKAFKNMVKKGVIKQYSGRQITASFRLQITDAVGAAVSFSGSVFSDTVRNLAIGIYQEMVVE
ncbi:hypothetical protein [Shewanella sp. OMA3-2]|uniref:hypothetical protein n=1 Tax=Shewanella sp. OMA3-2 TaxID=2908650 RepID=UPI001F415824|nr:hypothetical protein [Shewanella sp. OMA3-2]UJF22316.1 hypothetical protein L0B17_02450 [Shewanella sp. OMA3-2]